MKRTGTIGIICLLIIGGFVGFISFEPNIGVTGGKTLYVGGTGANNYTTIQSAVNAANSGDTIFVYDDSAPYFENIIIGKSINLIGKNRDTTIIDGGGTGDVVNISANWVNITGFTITNSGGEGQDAGLKLYSSQKCRINNNNVSSNNGPGIYLCMSSNNNIIINNYISFSGLDAVLLDLSSNNNITGNNISDNWCGILLLSSLYNNLIGNNISNTKLGIVLGSSLNNIIIGNVVKNNWQGICLSTSSNNSIINNNISNNNAPNGAISLYDSSNNNVIISNNVSNNGNGICLLVSLNNIIIGNDISSNYWDGIDLQGSNYNNITGNNILSNNDVGINLVWSVSNTITGNNVSLNNDYDIYLASSSNNSIYHNNIINNVNQSYDGTNANFWNDTYPSGGNYWSDYAGIDQYSGQNQDQPGSDGIGDTPYTNISGGVGATDYYPLMIPVSSGGITPTVPSHPQSLQATAGNNYVNLTWNLPTFNGFSPVSNYKIYRGNASENLLFLAEIGNQLFYNDTNVTNSITYYYIVSAVNVVGEGLLSNKVNATPQGPIFPFISNILYVGGSGPDNYTRIQAAIDDASDGNTVFVFDDSSPYYENIEINKSIKLVGESKETTIIQGKNVGNIIEVNASWVNITDFNITNTIISGAGIKLNNVENCQINNNKIINNSWGISVEKSNNNTILYNKIAFNTITGISLINSSNNLIKNNDVISNDWNGISIVSSSNNNVIMKNYVASNRENGILLRDSLNNTIISNDVNSNDWADIYLEHSSNNNKIIGNNVSNYIRYDVSWKNPYGIYICSGTSENHIESNNVSNKLTGIKIFGSSNKVYNNNIFCNMGGIGLLNSKYNSIIGNNLMLNGKYGGIHIDASSDNSIYHNNFLNNFKQVDYSRNLSPYVYLINYTNIWNNTYPSGGNYWSDYNGTDSDGDGIGDTPYIIDADSQDNYPLMEPWNITIQEPADITIHLQLNKTEFFVGEPITGFVQIFNNNSVNIYLNDEKFQTVSGFINPDELGVFFNIRSVDNAQEFEGFFNYPHQLKVEAQSSLVIEFKLDQFNEIINTSKDENFTGLGAGNYSIHSYFYYGDFPYYEILEYNIVKFRIVNKSQPFTNGDGKGPGQEESYVQTIIFTSTAGLILVMIIISLFVAGTEIGKYKFASMFIAPLYTRELKKRRKKDELVRGKVIGYIIGNPGDNYNTIKRKLTLTNGALAYHLQILERNHEIRSERDGVYKRFYPFEGRITEEILELSKLQKRIYNLIEQKPGITQTQISKQLGESVQRINYHIQMMVDARIIKLEREGKHTKCYIIENVK